MKRAATFVGLIVVGEPAVRTPSIAALVRVGDPAVVLREVFVVPGFELFGDAAPGGVCASCSRGWAECRPELVGGVGPVGSDDVFGTGAVEGVVDVGDGLGESVWSRAGGVEGRFPGVDGVLLVSDALLGLRDCFVRERERVVGGMKCREGGGDGSFVAPVSVSLC